VDPRWETTEKPRAQTGEKKGHSPKPALGRDEEGKGNSPGGGGNGAETHKGSIKRGRDRNPKKKTGSGEPNDARGREWEKKDGSVRKGHHHGVKGVSKPLAA